MTPSTGIRPKHQPYCTRSTQQAGTTATVAQTERCVCHSPAHPVAVENPPQPSSIAVMPTPCRHARATTGRRRATNPRGLHAASTKAVAAAPPAVRRRREDARRTAHSPPLTLRAHTSTAPRHTRRDWPPPRHYGAAPGQCRTSTAPHQPPGSRMAPAPRTSATDTRDRAQEPTAAPQPPPLLHGRTTAVDLLRCSTAPARRRSVTGPARSGRGTAGSVAPCCCRRQRRRTSARRTAAPETPPPSRRPACAPGRPLWWRQGRGMEGRGAAEVQCHRPRRPERGRPSG
jgi:hypothetical protein